MSTVLDSTAMEYFHHCTKFYCKEGVRGTKIDDQRAYDLDYCEGWQWLRDLLGLMILGILGGILA